MRDYPQVRLRSAIGAEGDFLKGEVMDEKLVELFMKWLKAFEERASRDQGKRRRRRA